MKEIKEKDIKIILHNQALFFVIFYLLATLSLIETSFLKNRIKNIKEDIEIKNIKEEEKEKEKEEMIYTVKVDTDTISYIIVGNNIYKIWRKTKRGDIYTISNE